MFFLKVIETFERHGIEYAVSGGYAAALHGYIQDIRNLEFVVDNSLEGFVEVQAALEDCGLRPLKYSAPSIFKLKNIESTWVWENSLDANERVIIYPALSVEDCRADLKSVYSYKVPVMTLYELQKKLDFQISRPELLTQKGFQLKATDILQILEDYRTLDSSKVRAVKDKSVLISIKIPSSLLEDFKHECSSENLKYQTQIKKLMKDWLA